MNPLSWYKMSSFFEIQESRESFSKKQITALDANKTSFQIIYNNLSLMLKTKFKWFISVFAISHNEGLKMLKADLNFLRVTL